MKENWFVVSKMTRICWILIRALRSPKNLHFDMSFPVKFDLKKSSGVIFHDTREWCTFEGKLTLAFKNDMRNLRNFHENTWKSQNWDFDGIILSKVENARALDLLGSYASWEWRMVQKLKRNWLLSSKLTWAIWQILIQALKNAL